MLVELRIENVGVLEEAAIVFGGGMTVVTGETGAGKTMVVEAVELLLGARADTMLVRQGAEQARVEARFVVDEGLLDDLRRVVDDDGDLLDGAEVVLSRVVPVDGRSRSYVNGRIVAARALGDIGCRLVELQGQHAHQALLAPAAQRSALDRAAGADAHSALGRYRTLRRRLREIDAEVDRLGGDERERARSIDLLRYQLDEIDAVAIDGPDEERRLAELAETLASATAIRQMGEEAHARLDDEAVDALGAVVDTLGSARVFAAIAERLRVVQDEVAGAARELRRLVDEVEQDPARLEEVEQRRKLLGELRRKYGDTLDDVLVFRDEASVQLHALESASARVADLAVEREQVVADLRAASAELSAARRAAAGRLATEVTAELHDLALPDARFEIEVTPGSWDDDRIPDDGLDRVEFLLAANPGDAPRPLARVASGGELARTMLAIRVVLSEAPPTLVFDEVDAGIGGRAGVAVGRRLAAVATGHQVLCVTHLAQVAAFAHGHVVIEKEREGARTVARAQTIERGQRVAELSRMLAGSGSEAARDHAEELLAVAAQEQTR